MAVSVLARCSRLRCFIGMGNNAATLSPSAVYAQRLYKSQPYTTSVDDSNVLESEWSNSNRKMSKAMVAYLQRAKEHDELMNREIAEYEIGKRHLANMMGEDPETFTQEDIDRSIEYLFPSALHDPKAKPMMRHPSEIFPHRKASEFDESGRPFHSMFYTTKPNYYETLYNVMDKMKALNDIEDSLIRQGTSAMDRVNLIGSTWLTHAEMEKLLLEKIFDKEYSYFITSLERLCDHPLSNRETEFIMKHRKQLVVYSDKTQELPLEYDSTGRPYVTVKQCLRKSSIGEVTIWGNGSGKISINGQDITYFQNYRHREQILYPLMFADMMDKVDIEATVVNGGPTGQSGAIRWGIAWGLRSFVDKSILERMRIAGLLTRDWRRRERKKPGQEGARRKYTWQKR